MRQALQKTWPLTLLGLALTAFIAGAVYYFESKVLAQRAQVRTAQVLERAKDRLQQIIWHVDLTADSLKQSDTIWPVASFNNFLSRLEPDLPKDSSWLVSAVLPSSDKVLATQQLREYTGLPNAELRNNSTGKFLAPVMFASPQWLGKLAGFDMFSASKLGDLYGTDQWTPGKTRLALLPKPLNGEDWQGGSLLLLNTVQLGTAQKNDYVVVRVIPSPELSSLLEIDDERTFAAQDPTEPGLTLGNAALVGVAGGFTRDLELQGLKLKLTLEPVKPLNTSVWLPILIIGTLLTVIMSLALISKHLGLRLRHDSAQLSGAQLTLRQIRNSEEALFENAGTANCVVEAGTGKFLRVNSRMVDLLGYTAQELLTKTFADVTHPDDLAASHAVLAGALEQQKSYIQFEKRYVHKNGSAVYCLVNSRVIPAPDGKPSAFATAIIDITQAKAQDRLRDNLVRELAHRVRNNVQLTATIARQTAKTARSVRDFDDKFQRRLNALRAAQDTLFDANWTVAPLDVIINRSLSPFQPGADIKTRLEVSVPPILLPAQHAQTVAIAVHELATNSQVWGALARNGKAKLSGWVDSSGGADVLVLEWSESSDHIIRAPKKRGFGMRMLEIGLPEQFAGTAELKWRKNGMDYRANLPLANAQLV